MNRRIWSIAALLVLAPFQKGYAQDMHRCLGAHGEPVFSDRPCNAANAGATSQGSVGHVDAASALIRGRCAASTEELRGLVITAMQARDTIAFSGLILWGDGAAKSVRAQLSTLATLTQEPLQSVELELATASQGLPFGEQHALLLRTLRNADRVPQMAETRYALINRDGCWWWAQ